jgi:hypothetical protein
VSSACPHPKPARTRPHALESGVPGVQFSKRGIDAQRSTSSTQPVGGQLSHHQHRIVSVPRQWHACRQPGTVDQRPAHGILLLARPHCSNPSSSGLSLEM